MNKLTPEEERVIVHKGTERPILASTTHSPPMENTCAVAVIIAYTPQTQNFRPVVAGRVSTMNCPAGCVEFQMQTEGA